MSLVAYAASSDEESDYDQDDKTTEVFKHSSTRKLPIKSSDNISDEDDDYEREELTLQNLKPCLGKFTLSLPKPKQVQVNNTEENNDLITQIFARLPMPRSATALKEIVEEVDDEYLHKKAIPSVKDALEKPKAPTTATKGRVKINIPSLREFKDVDKEKAEKSKSLQSKIGNQKGSGLLSILPKAKSELNFAKKLQVETPITTQTTTSTSRPAFIPDTVRSRRPAHNTECVDGIKATAKKSLKQPIQDKSTLVNCSDSEASDGDDDSGDFFSLNIEQKLPEVNAIEIDALVAKRAAKMVEATTNYLNASAEQEAAEAERLLMEQEQQRQAQKRYHEKHLDAEAMDALVGKNAKRRRKETKEMQVIDISSSEVLPDREEWLRTNLTSSTTYQPTGVLNEDEAVAGTRRKHQITYLAHKAKSNEAELQAMWAANRQTRRATQSKYGF